MRARLSSIGGTSFIRLMTDEEQQKYDPRGQIKERFDSMTDKTSHGTPCEFISNHSRIWYVLDQMRKQGVATRHAPFCEFDASMLAKVGVQGGNVSYDTLISTLNPYYTTRPIPVIDPILYKGRDILLSKLRTAVERYGYPDVVYKNIAGTFAGSPTSGHKGEYSAETEGMPINKAFFHFYPVVPWYRDYRQSIRTIFMDSNVNVKSTGWIFSSVRSYLVKVLPEYFDAWRNPSITLRKRMTEAAHKRAYSIEWDYMKMDTNVRWTLIHELILPIYQYLLLPICGQNSLEILFKQFFDVPLIIGSYLVEGEHSLFSGMNPTNDWETLYTVMLALGILAEFNILDSKRNAFNLFAQGDDMTLTIASKHFSVKDCEEIMNAAIEVSNKANMIIHPLGTKSVVREGGMFQFCRHLYYLSGKKDQEGALYGSYPTCLAVNSILNPEHHPANFHNFCASTLQRLDGLIGTHQFGTVVDLIVKNIKSPMTTDAETLILNRGTDWWERVYGVRWNPTSSPSYQYLKLNNKF